MALHSWLATHAYHVISDVRVKTRVGEWRRGRRRHAASASNVGTVSRRDLTAPQ